MSVRRIAALAGAVGLALSLGACGRDGTDGTDDLVIGVSGTDPGISWVDPDGSFSGFDVDLAAYLAQGLGWDLRDVRFEMVADDDRESALANGDVDMVVSSYAITEQREDVVDFAGPYFVAGQDLLVARDSRIAGPHSLTGQLVCGAADTPELDRLAADAPRARLRAEPDLVTCVDLLLTGQVAAVTADDVVLAGYAEDHPADLRVVGSPISTDFYGVGLPEGSPDVAAVDQLIVRALEDGTWQADVDRHFGRSGYVAPPPPPPGSRPS